MAKIKGCLNDNCVENAKKTKFKEELLYCSKCGNKLVYVCPLCYEELENKNDKICEKCRKQKEDKKAQKKENTKATIDKTIEILKAVPPGVAEKVLNKENLDKAVEVAKVVAKKVVKK